MRLFLTALKLIAAVVALAARPAFAQTEEAEAEASVGALDLLSPATVTLHAQIRAVAFDGERSWIDGGFGKLRHGGSNPARRADLGFKPELAEATVVWKPRLSWSLSGTIVGTIQNTDQLEAGLSEAYLTFKPLSAGAIRFSARAGLMWPPISLEHSGDEWSVAQTITPSAINSWVGEEVKVIGLEATLETEIDGTKLKLTGGLFDGNDTAGTLLSYRGWALHDTKAAAFQSWALPKRNTILTLKQASFTTPVLTIADMNPDNRFGRNPGNFLKIVVEPTLLPMRFELFRYDNHAQPEDYLHTNEWGWNTRFYNLGAVADLGPRTQLRAQAMTGDTVSGLVFGGENWIQTRFRSAFALLTQRFGRGSVSGRVEAFDTRNKGSKLLAEDDETGWALTLAGKRAFGRNATGLLEVIHVSSDRDARAREGLAARQEQTQIMAALRLNW